MTNKKVKLIKPNHKYTTPVKIEIDQDFINTIKLVIETLEHENRDYRR